MIQVVHSFNVLRIELNFIAYMSYNVGFLSLEHEQIIEEFDYFPWFGTIAM